MKRSQDAGKGDLPTGKDSRADKHDSGTPGSQEKATVLGRVEMLGDFPRTVIAANNGKPHSGAVLKTPEGRLVVHLGPAGYFQQHDFPIRAGDLLEVLGSTILMAAHQAIMLAAEVRRNGKRLKLRNDRGLPLWEPPMTKKS
jgi:hypothetical protein